MIHYLFLFIVVVIIVIFITIRLTFKFWAIQPVFHIYDVHRWLNSDRIIDISLPKVNKYVKLIDVETYDVKSVSQDERDMVVKFICENYLVNYSPEVNDIFPYFSTSLGKSYLSIFLDNVFKNSVSELNYNGRDVIGIITSRPLFLTFSGKEPMIINYIDNLTVRTDRRKEGIAPKLIQTHHYRIRHIDNNVKVSMFKRENDMTAIVPLTIYTRNEFDILDICDDKVNRSHQLVKIDKNNFILLKTIIKMSASRFKCTLNIEQTTLFELVMISKIVIYILLNETTPICCYVLRRNAYVSDDLLKCVDLISSINCSPNTDVFFAGFQSLCRRENKKHSINRIIIEELGDNCALSDHVKSRGIKVSSQCPCAFFLYNYVRYSIKPSECLFIY